ncbi:carbohydrate ABC transporter permease [Anaerolineae bacterium CFX7]|nr:carbohydrate ABC transporter permease [Anaerolineae bacterium CFX7]
MNQTHTAARAQPNVAARNAARKRRQITETIFWYALLLFIAAITILPLAWTLLTSLKGPNDAIFAVPLQLLPKDPTLDNYARVWKQLPVANFFINSIIVSVATTTLNVLFTALAAYPFAKMKFWGRDVIFYLLLATFIVPPQLTYIPGFVLARNVFQYYDTLLALIFPNLATVFNIFLLRQAFKSVPNDLIDAAKIDGASELRIWWQILLPVIRPSLATAAIITFVTSWNDFLWPSLMLPTMVNKTLPVGLAALQGMFASDLRATAAGIVMTIIPILILFIFLQRQFVRGMTGAVKG